MGGLTSCAAIDLGASSGRVAVVDWDGGRLALREARRFETPQYPDTQSGYQCWDLEAMEREIRAGLEAAARMAELESVGVDGWGVDYVLLDAQRRLVGPAVAYRDDRTRGMMERVFSRMPREELYRRTGIQFQPFNTLYQLAATRAQQQDWLERARHLAMLPDYFHHRLGGALGNEYTNATTTQLFAVERHDWDEELFGLAGASRGLVSTPVEPGTIIGEGSTGEGSFKITAPATHDTGSAVAALPLGPDDLFLISGTWSLMGVESGRPLLSDAALRCNLTNEGGVERRYRSLKNIAGLWLTQRLAQELGQSESDLVAAASQATGWRTLIDPDDPRFLNPPSMVAAIRACCQETGQEPPHDAGALVRCALESLALSYQRTRSQLEHLFQRSLVRIVVGGGGGKNLLLNQLTADACQLPVQVGPAESSLLGNACVQLIGLGAFSSLEDARRALRRCFDAREIEPQSSVPDAARERFARLVSSRVPDPGGTPS